MTATQHLIAFVAMAAAIVTILVIGTLVAADILHVGRRREGSGTSSPARRVDLRETPPFGEHEKELAASSPDRSRASR